MEQQPDDAGLVALPQNTTLGGGTGVYRTQCPDCGSLNLAAVTVKVDPTTRAPLGKRPLWRTLAIALLCLIIGLTALIAMRVSMLDEAMGVEGIWIFALPVACVNLIAFGFLLAGVRLAVGGLIAALRTPNGYLRTCAACGKQWM